MKSLKQLRNDFRIYNIEILGSESDNKYLVNLEDGWVFDDGTHINGFATIKEINEEINRIEKEK